MRGSMAGNKHSYYYRLHTKETIWHKILYLYNFLGMKMHLLPPSLTFKFMATVGQANGCSSLGQMFGTMARMCPQPVGFGMVGLYWLQLGSHLSGSTHCNCRVKQRAEPVSAPALLAEEATGWGQPRGKSQWARS